MKTIDKFLYYGAIVLLVIISGTALVTLVYAIILNQTVATLRKRLKSDSDPVNAPQQKSKNPLDADKNLLQDIKAEDIPLMQIVENKNGEDCE